MEVAVFIDRIDQLHSTLLNGIISDRNDSYHNSINENLAQLVECLDGLGIRNYDRVYFGSEFCDRCIPSEDELIKVIHFCKTNNLEFTFVTPPLSDTGLNICMQRIRFLEQRLPSMEVVVNDIGLASLLTQRTNITLVLGRIFDKLSHDGRTCREEMQDYYGEKGALFAGQSNIFSHATGNLLNRFGIERVEMDLPFQKVYVGERRLNLYVPFSYMTTGRRCVFLRTSASGTKEQNAACGKECVKYRQLMKKPTNRLGANSYFQMFQKGNTIYFANHHYHYLLDKAARLVVEVQL